MSEFDINNNPENNEEVSGTVSGFDSVNDKPCDSTEDAGYTVTPDGGYYTKPHSEIIQDEAFVRPQEPAPDSYTPPVNSTPNPSPYYGTPKKPKNKKGVSVWVTVLASVLAAVIGAVSGVAAIRFIPLKNTAAGGSSDGKNTTVNINIDETVESVAEAVAKKATPSVVGIRTTTSVMSFFGGSSEATGEGSGVIYTEDGYIITNYHVISSAVESNTATKIEVFLESNQSEPHLATVVGYNISSDLAVIKINKTGLPAVDIGDSKELKTGQYVITIGNPGGLEFMGSVTYGIISGLNRTVSSSLGVELIQTDAAINPGNSGGALLNTKGELIGINSSKIVSEEYEGMGFAIPVNTVIEKCDRIIARENEPEPYIGITISEKYTPEVLRYYGFPVGAVVLSVDKGSPAYSAGIRKGDIVTEFGGTEISNYTMFEELLFECEPEQTVSITIYRSGRSYPVNIKIGSNNAN